MPVSSAGVPNNFTVALDRARPPAPFDGDGRAVLAVPNPGGRAIPAITSGRTCARRSHPVKTRRASTPRGCRSPACRCRSWQRTGRIPATPDSMVIR